MFAVGCATRGKVSSVKDESYTGKLERVLVVYQGKAATKRTDTTATLGRNFQQRLGQRLADSLSRQSIPSETAGLDESAVDRDAPVKMAVARFEPKQVLYASVSQISGTSTLVWVNRNDFPYSTHNVLITLEFEVTDVASDKTVWRSSVSFYSAPGVETAADQVLSELQKAKLL